SIHGCRNELLSLRRRGVDPRLLFSGNDRKTRAAIELVVILDAATFDRIADGARVLRRERIASVIDRPAVGNQFLRAAAGEQQKKYRSHGAPQNWTRCVWQ